MNTNWWTLIHLSFTYFSWNLEFIYRLKPSVERERTKWYRMGEAEKQNNVDNKIYINENGSFQSEPNEKEKKEKRFWNPKQVWIIAIFLRLNNIKLNPLDSWFGSTTYNNIISMEMDLGIPYSEYSFYTRNWYWCSAKH